MDQRVDLAQRSLIGNVERRHDARDGAWAEADAHEVTRDQVEAVGDGVGEGARGSADAGEHRDLRGARHRS